MTLSTEAIAHITEKLSDEIAARGLDPVRIICAGTESTIEYTQLSSLQDVHDKHLKETSMPDIEKLCLSILRNGLVAPLQICLLDGSTYAFDAHHRCMAFTVLASMGVPIPPLPYTTIIANNYGEALRLLLEKERAASWVSPIDIDFFINEINYNNDDGFMQEYAEPQRYVDVWQETALPNHFDEQWRRKMARLHSAIHADHPDPPNLEDTSHEVSFTAHDDESKAAQQHTCPNCGFSWSE